MHPRKHNNQSTMHFDNRLFLVVVVLTLAELVTSNNNVGSESNGMFGKLANFLGEVGHMAGEIGKGVQKLSRHIRNVEEFLDATLDEDCVFECPEGWVAKPRPSHVPTSNGCGSYGLEEYLKADYLPLEEFVECCHSHDRCYGTCGEDREDCDLRFKKCLYARCRESRDSVSHLKYKGCQAGAKLLYTGTTAVGCKPYLEAQETACVCLPRSNNKPYNSKDGSRSDKSKREL